MDPEHEALRVEEPLEKHAKSTYPFSAKYFFPQAALTNPTQRKTDKCMLIDNCMFRSNL